MKILFLHPPWPGKGYGLRSQNRWPRKRGDKTNRYPILLCYTATLLKNNKHNVKYIDSVILDLSLKGTLKKIKEFNPEIIFIETSTPTFDFDVKFINEVKDKYPKIIILVAGTHVTKFPIESLKGSKIDVIIKGEQDITTLNVVNAIKNKKPLDKIKGICFKKKNKIVNNPNAPLILNLNKLPFPDRDLIPHQWYAEGHVRNFPFTFVMGARGCPNNCTFCLWPNIYYGHKVRIRSPKNIVDELEWLIKKYNMKEVFFDEDTFNISKKRVEDICKEIIKRNVEIVWGCSARVDCVDLNMLELMKKAGCKLMCYGAESANQKTLNRTKKNITIEQIKRAVKLTKEVGIITHVNLMIGFPWETEKEIKETIDFGLKLKADTVQYSLVFPHPGSEMFDEAINQGWFYEDVLKDFSKFDMTSGPVLKTRVPREKLVNIVSKAHAKFFLRPDYILKQLLKIRNYKDLKYTFKGAKSVIKGKILFKR
ncbi:MAG: radical SAM protein [archaeon]